MEKETLTLHVTKEWYDKIANGEKTEEYRDISLYWTERFLSDNAYHREDVISIVKSGCKQDYFMLGYLCGGSWSTEAERSDRWERKLKPFKYVRFICGYPKDNEPCIIKEITDITVDKPKKGMCPDGWLDKLMYVIKFKGV